MVINHYWVSGIQVAGLIIGLYGLFFLSQSVFGEKSLTWLRATLPASGSALTSYVMLPSLPIPMWLKITLFIVATLSTYLLAVLIGVMDPDDSLGNDPEIRKMRSYLADEAPTATARLLFLAFIGIGAVGAFPTGYWVF